MLFLLTNDDGIDAPGLTAQYEALTSFLAVTSPQSEGETRRPEIVVVAPDRGRSECGHSVTTGRELFLREVRPGWFSLDGTPVDCVRVALTTICPSATAVFSGINAGANVGVDLLVSGTFAAAREAALLGRPAMAISHYRRPDVPKTWEHAAKWLRPVFAQYFEHYATRLYPQDTEALRPEEGGEVLHGPLWNVNLPACDPEGPPPTIVHCPVERRPLVRQGKWMAREIRWQRLHGTSGQEPIADVNRTRAIDDEKSTSGPTMRQAGSHSDKNLREGQVELASDFHGRPRDEGTDVERCFSGDLTISVLQPHLS